MEPIVFNTEYLNRTVNKAARRAELIHSPGYGYLAVLWHETDGNRANPRNTLDWNLHERDPKSGKLIQSSYDYLIDQWGVIWQYIDSRVWTSYHAGVSSWKAPNGTLYRDYPVNEVLLSVEVDGPNDGTPITAAALQSAGRLAIHFRDEFGIPLTRAYHPEHREVAPGRKTDPRGYRVDDILAAANALRGTKPAQTEIVATTTYVVTSPIGLKIRTQPNTSTESLVVRVMQQGEYFPVSEVIQGEVVTGVSEWLHVADGSGFASMAWAEKVQ